MFPEEVWWGSTGGIEKGWSLEQHDADIAQLEEEAGSSSLSWQGTSVRPNRSSRKGTAKRWGLRVQGREQRLVGRSRGNTSGRHACGGRVMCSTHRHGCVAYGDIRIAK
jgi:hypothetical protein